MPPHMDCSPLTSSLGPVRLELDLERKVVVVADMGIPPPIEEEGFLTECTPYPGGTWVVEDCPIHNKRFVWADDVTPAGLKVRMIWGCETQMMFYQL